MRTSDPGEAVGPELLLQLDAAPGRTLRIRVSAAIREAVRSGRLGPGARLPSTRSLASDLGLSRGVVVDAYAQLTGEGLLVSRPGSGTSVADLGPVGYDRTTSGEKIPAYPVGIDLRPGPPDLSAFPRSIWLAAMRNVLRELPDHELGYVNPSGTEALRASLAEYLPRVRSAVAGQDTVIVASGVTQGLTLLVRVLRDSGHRELAVESPSNSVQRGVLGSHGLRIVDVPVDEHGINVQALARTRCRAVLVTPAHQFPRGVVLTAARRAALLRWADDVDGVILEDDYDAEFRYERLPMGCLQGLAPARVVLLGSVSKTLAPGLRLGWVIAPTGMREQIIAAKRDDDFGTGVLEQHTLAWLLDSGAYDRHVRGLRRRYRDRRDTLLAALEKELPGWPVAGVAAGLHLLLDLPPGVDEESVVMHAAALGLAVQGTEAMYGELPPKPALVLSYARRSTHDLNDGVRKLALAAEAGRLPRSKHVDDIASRHLFPAPATALDYF